MNLFTIDGGFWKTNGSTFSTFDYGSSNKSTKCAVLAGGGWWFALNSINYTYSCASSIVTRTASMKWTRIDGVGPVSVAQSRMMIKCAY